MPPAGPAQERGYPNGLVSKRSLFQQCGERVSRASLLRSRRTGGEEEEEEEEEAGAP